MKKRPVSLCVLLTICASLCSSVAAEKPAAQPAVGDAAADFTLSTPAGKEVTLSKLTAEGPVVLIMLRGYPTYQCPVCSRQVQDFIGKADQIKAAGARVVMVYPGEAKLLKEHAEDFVKDTKLPAHFDLVLDPDYGFTNLYNLRWEAAKETAYPSTFVIDREGKIRFAKISKTHSGRAKAEEVLEALSRLGGAPAAQ